MPVKHVYPALFVLMVTAAPQFVRAQEPADITLSPNANQAGSAPHSVAGASFTLDDLPALSDAHTGVDEAPYLVVPAEFSKFFADRVE